MKIRTSGVSKLWLDKVLNFRGGWKPAARQLTVVDFSLRPALPLGGNLASATFRVTARYLTGGSALAAGADDEYDDGGDGEEVGELFWFVKFLPAGPRHRALMAATGAFEHEHSAYEHLLPAMVDALDAAGAAPDCYPDVPDCIYSSCDAYDVSIVLEDLTARGFRAPSRLDGLTAEETRLALRALARFHASGIEVARQLGDDADRADALPALESDPFRSEVLQGAFQAKEIFYRMAAALKDLPDQAENADRLKAYIDRTPSLMARVDRLMKEQDAPRGYICGDCWSNNFMFRYEEDGTPAEVKLLDFQMCHYGLPQADLHYLLNSGMSPEVRAQFDSMLREDYYEELFRVLEALYSPVTREEWPFQRFYETYKATAEFGLVMAMIALPLTFAPLVATSRRGSDASVDGDNQDAVGNDSFAPGRTMDLSLDAIGDMTTEVLKGEAAGLIRERFAEVVQTMVDLGVL